MEDRKPNLFTRDDTMLGVCQAIGDDIGFNPNWLRVGFGVALILNPVAVIAAYLGLGVMVLATRLLIPARSRKAKVEAPAQAVQAEAAQGENDTLELAQAA